MMRVLLLNTSFRSEGPNNTFREIAAHAPEYGIELFAAALSGRGSMEGVYRSMGIPTVYFGRPGLENFSTGGLVNRFIRDHGIDLLHCQLLRGEVVGALATRSLENIATVCTVQNEDPYRIWWRNPVKASLSRWALKHAEAVVAVSHSLREFIHIYQKVEPERITVIPNAVDARKYRTRDSYPPPDDFPDISFIIGTVGRLALQKGQRYLIDAFHRIARKVPHAELIIVGSGPLEGRLRRLASRGLGAKRIRFIGWKSRVEKYLPYFGIYIQPSLWEGMPFATLEAMASGVPVIASSVGGLRELITHDHNGILVSPKDIDALGNAILRLAGDEEFRLRLSREARHKIHSDYLATDMAREYCQLYRRLVSDKNRAKDLPGS